MAQHSASAHEAVVVRSATVGDGVGIAALRFAWRRDDDPELAIDLTEFTTRFVEWWRSQEGIVGFVAEAGGSLVAMGFLALNPRVPGPGDFDRRQGNVQTVYVLPAWRGHGVGTRIVAELVALAKASNCARVTVHAARRAVSLYEASGFIHSEQLLMLPAPVVPLRTD